MKFYLDTSVFGGYWDEIFKEDTIAFLEYAKETNAELIYSDVTKEELEGAPEKVQKLVQSLKEIEGKDIKIIEINDEAEKLAKRYIEEGALTKKCENDARHIALASIYVVNALVSWNFKHMVNFVRLQQYNAINLSLGYRPIDIRSPKEIKEITL
jgi:predicted nucleic acid-binding protein